MGVTNSLFFIEAKALQYCEMKLAKSLPHSLNLPKNEK